ncbi:hypothetical protein MKW98_001935 [Papaver atlanticum]|uniref:tryptophan synthase n=1 Tax=Papaver atlanticum TaxID=357466 RepID=A0AAD4T4R6_9MAGN|nr:hypothetical protein MKW98_001935 [Papaver atlanticum]
MATAMKTTLFLQPKKSHNQFVSHSTQRPNVSFKSFTVPMASISTTPTVGLSETFSKLKKQGKVVFIPYITAGDPDLSTTAEALKVLDSCGSDIIELGIPYSDPLADGPVIQATTTRALARGTSFNAILDMLKEVIPQLSCPVALFTYYNPILKRGVLLTTPTTPTERMKPIVEAAEGFVYLVSSIGVIGARTSVSDRVQSLLQDIKKATDKPVAVGFGISKPEQVQQVAGWGADGVIVGSAMVKLLGEAKSPEEGLKELEAYTKTLKAALP